MKKIEEIKKEIEERTSTKAEENLIKREAKKYYKRKRFIFSILFLFIAGMIFYFWKNIFSILRIEYSERFNDSSIKIAAGLIVALLVVSIIPFVYALTKKNNPKHKEFLEEEKIRLIKKEILETKREIEEIEKEKNYLIEEINDKEKEIKIMESMI